MVKKVALSLCLALVASSALPYEARAQQTPNRPSRRVTNPVPVQRTPQVSEPTVVSTADEPAQDADAARRSTPRTRRNAEAGREQEQDQLRRTVTNLSAQVDKLSEELRQMRDDQRAIVNLERLTRAEQRAENLRTQLRDALDKEFQYQERLAQIEDELQPAAIERRAAVYGSLRPAEVRDQIRRGLERERDRLQRQLELLATSRVRLEAAVATADAEVERLRERVDAADRERNETQLVAPVIMPPDQNDDTTPAVPPGE